MIRFLLGIKETVNKKSDFLIFIFKSKFEKKWVSKNLLHVINNIEGIYQNFAKVKINVFFFKRTYKSTTKSRYRIYFID